MTSADSFQDPLSMPAASEPDWNGASQQSLSEAAKKKLAIHKYQIHKTTDRMFAALMVVQWIGLVIASLILTPVTWVGADCFIHPHVWMAFGDGALLVCLPLWMAIRNPGGVSTRLIMATSQVLFSTLIIHLAGGRIESHFHIFGSMAFLAAYRDWRVFVPATLIVVTDHIVRGVWWPESIFGVGTSAPYRWVEHAAWVCFEVLFLLICIRQSVKEMYRSAWQSAQLDATVKASAERERQFRAGFNQAAVGMTQQTLEGRFRRVNSRFCEITGYSSKQLLTMRCRDVTYPDDIADHEERMQKLLEGNDTHFVTEKRYLHRDGHTIWARITMSVVRDRDGKPDHLLSVVEEITAEKKAKQEIKKLSLVATMARHSVIISDANGHVEWVNDAFTSTTGFTAEEIRGKRPGELLQGPKTDPATVKLISKRLKKHQPVNVEIVNYHRDGHTYWVNLVIEPVFDAQGQLLHFVATQSDITDRRERDRELLEATQAAQAANRSKSLFLANMSHEIRTPLNGILGFAELLSHDAISDEERKEYVQTIRTSGNHLLMLINDILDLSKIEAGQMQIEKLEFSPHQLLSEVVSIMRVKAQEKSIDLDYRWDTPIPQTVVSDPSRLRQLLMNLVGNAIKFTERGMVSIVAKYHVEAGQAMVTFAVQDTGVGVAKESIKKIFKPFSQADETVTRRFGGTGLGLTISRNIAKSLGGALTVESELGVGSIFAATFNGGDAAAVELTDSKNVWYSSDITQAGEQEVNLDGCHVLVVDDGDTNRKLITLMLKRVNAKVSTAENGAEAVEQALALDVDIVLMDIQMPVMDGYTATTTLRQNGFEAPIIALTANAMKGDRQLCETAGCSGYLSKPIDGDRLLKTISAELAKASPSKLAAPPKIDAPLPAALGESSGKETPMAPNYHSSLPTDDAEIREIVEEFVDKLDSKLELMIEAIDKEDYDQVAELAHWLKGAGGTVGYNCFTEPASLLEKQAKANDAAAVRESLAAVEGITKHLVV